jgi:hypothetical protein
LTRFNVIPAKTHLRVRQIFCDDVGRLVAEVGVERAAVHQHDALQLVGRWFCQEVKNSAGCFINEVLSLCTEKFVPTEKFAPTPFFVCLLIFHPASDNFCDGFLPSGYFS